MISIKHGRNSADEKYARKSYIANTNKQYTRFMVLYEGKSVVQKYRELKDQNFIITLHVRHKRLLPLHSTLLLCPK